MLLFYYDDYEEEKEEDLEEILILLAFSITLADLQFESRFWYANSFVPFYLLFLLRVSCSGWGYDCDRVSLELRSDLSADFPINIELPKEEDDNIGLHSRQFYMFIWVLIY